MWIGRFTKGSSFTGCFAFRQILFVHNYKHERLFSYQRLSASGKSIPTWLTTQEKVLLKRHVRKSEYGPLVDEVDLIDVNPEYAHVRFSDGKESTVSVRDLAPCGIISNNNIEQVNADIMTNSRPDQSQSHEISADIPEISIDKDLCQRPKRSKRFAYSSFFKR